MNGKTAAKMSLAFAVGVALSAGYVALGSLQASTPRELVVVQERCSEPDDAAAPEPRTELAVERFNQRPGSSDGYVEAVIPSRWRLAQVSTGVTPLADGLAIGLQREGLIFGDEASGIDPSAVWGHIIVALDKRLDTLSTTPNHANLYLDPDAPMRDVINIMYTLGRHGVRSYQLAVDRRLHQPAVRFGLMLRPPLFVADPSGPTPDHFQLIVAVRADGVHVGRRPSGPDGVNIAKFEPTVWVAKFAWGVQTMTELERLAVEIASEQPTAVVFSVEPELPVARLFEAMEAATGTCTMVEDDDGTRHCRFIDRGIEVGE